MWKNRDKKENRVKDTKAFQRTPTNPKTQSKTPLTLQHHSDSVSTP
jgi:hypothetical protein